MYLNYNSQKSKGKIHRIGNITAKPGGIYFLQQALLHGKAFLHKKKYKLKIRAQMYAIYS